MQKDLEIYFRSLFAFCLLGHPLMWSKKEKVGGHDLLWLSICLGNGRNLLQLFLTQAERD